MIERGPMFVACGCGLIIAVAFEASQVGIMTAVAAHAQRPGHREWALRWLEDAPSFEVIVYPGISARVPSRA